ncbi:GNAT family N-acetyltransferase [Sphingoaurantiacus capsulatus]|uniref:GNAT family N-acetyltransferase n=1 Tax=Sphingoaurantiacus capsulatus TaxID=1771310 RepID=A0ABV7X5N0_9SPHN
MGLIIRPAAEADRAAIWSIIAPTLRAGETYTLPRDMREADALAYWFAPSHAPFVVEDAGEVVGTYYLRANQQGGGAHVANCGYMTSAAATGRGIARAMCEHSQTEARARGFRAMQFNIVISTNTRAVALWESCGFAVVGRLPGAFDHPTAGFVDALVMFKTL